MMYLIELIWFSEKEGKELVSRWSTTIFLNQFGRACGNDPKYEEHLWKIFDLFQRAFLISDTINNIKRRTILWPEGDKWPSVCIIVSKKQDKMGINGKCLYYCLKETGPKENRWWVFAGKRKRANPAKRVGSFLL